MISKLAVVDKEMVASRLGGLLTYSNFVHAVSGATVSIDFFLHYQSCQKSIWNTFIACIKCDIYISCCSLCCKNIILLIQIFDLQKIL